MIKVFYGDDRGRALQDAQKFLGSSYETIDAEQLTPDELTSIFYGATFFATKRQILIRDFLVNSLVADKLPNFLNTPHKIALLEFKVDKRSTIYKSLKDKIDFLEYNLKVTPVFRAAYHIYDCAKNDPKKALAELKPLEKSENPIALLGLFVSKALKDFAERPTAENKRVLKLLAKTDLALKSTNFDQWLILESFLLQLSI